MEPDRTHAADQARHRQRQSVNTGVAVGTPIYTPSSSLKDIAGNTINTSAFSAPATSRF